MATSADQSIEQEYEDLRDRQRLRAAIHYTTMKICQETENKYGLTISQQVVATITETVWRQLESFAVDLEHFAKHARRLVISPDDVKLLVRRNPCLLKHIQALHQEQLSGREEPKKRGRKGKLPPAETVTTGAFARSDGTKSKKSRQAERGVTSKSAVSAEREEMDVEEEKEEED